MNPIEANSQQPSIIKVIGVGGGGGEAVLRVEVSSLTGDSCIFLFTCIESEDGMSSSESSKILMLPSGSTKVRTSNLGALAVCRRGNALVCVWVDPEDALGVLDFDFDAAGFGGGRGASSSSLLTRLITTRSGLGDDARLETEETDAEKCIYQGMRTYS